MASSYPVPQRGASMMLAFRMSGKLTVIVGAGRLAASRALHALEADSRVVILCRGGVNGGSCCDELRWRAEIGEVDVKDLADICNGHGTSEGGPLAEENEVTGIERFLAQSLPVSLVCVTDTLICGKATTASSTRRSRGFCNIHPPSMPNTQHPGQCRGHVRTLRFHILCYASFLPTRIFEARIEQEGDSPSNFIDYER